REDHVDRREKDLAQTQPPRVLGEEQIEIPDHLLMSWPGRRRHVEFALEQLVALAVGRCSRQVGVRQDDARRHGLIPFRPESSPGLVARPAPAVDVQSPRRLLWTSRTRLFRGRRGDVYFGGVAEASTAGRVAEEAVRLDGVRGGRRDERFPARVARLYLREDV